MPERRAGDSLVAGCHEAIRRGSLSFAGAARLFAPETREAAYLLYAWCRHCDDQIDGERLGLRTAGVAEAAHAQRDRLDRLVDMTRRALAGESVPDPAFQALGRVVERHGIPAIYPFELLEGFAMDVDEARYARPRGPAPVLLPRGRRRGPDDGARDGRPRGDARCAARPISALRFR